MNDRDDIVDALRYAVVAADRKRRRIFLALIYCIVFTVIILFFTSCAPKDKEPSCGEENQYQCVNLCSGLYLKRQSNWFRYFKNELDCNVERNPVYEEYR